MARHLAADEAIVDAAGKGRAVAVPSATVLLRLLSMAILRHRLDRPYAASQAAIKGPIAAPLWAPCGDRALLTPSSIDPWVVVRKEQANNYQQNGYRYRQERGYEKAGRCRQNIADRVDDAAALVVGHNRRYRVTSNDHRIFEQLPSAPQAQRQTASPT